MEAKAFGFHLSVPRCVRATRGGRSIGDPGRSGIVQRAGKVEIVRHPQTKGRATGNANVNLEPLAVGVDISASEIPAEAVPEVGAGRGTQERRQSKRRRTVATSNSATRFKRAGGGGRPRTQLR
jgi:hypothetical protein